MFTKQVTVVPLITYITAIINGCHFPDSFLLLQANNVQVVVSWLFGVVTADYPNHTFDFGTGIAPDTLPDNPTVPFYRGDHELRILPQAHHGNKLIIYVI